MNAEIERAFANILREAVLPVGVENAGQRVIAASWQVEPDTGGNVMDPEKDWLIVKVEGMEHPAGPLWRGTVAFHGLVRALTSPPDPASIRAAMRNVRLWISKTPNATLKTSFDAACSECTLAGTFLAPSLDPEQVKERWRATIVVTCGFIEI